jgi:hypothetical protein
MKEGKVGRCFLSCARCSRVLCYGDEEESSLRFSTRFYVDIYGLVTSSITDAIAATATAGERSSARHGEGALSLSLRGVHTGKGSHCLITPRALASLLDNGG